MKNPLIDLLAHLNMNQLCSDCENWTQDSCYVCGIPMCEECMDNHDYEHIVDDEEK